MKLYNHYKNKPYKFIGIAKHSETQSDVVIYECRYENPSGKLWVRPKDMFFETVEVAGKTVARFAKIPIELKVATEVTDQHIKTILPIAEKCLGECDPSWFRSRLESRTEAQIVMAYVEGKCVGFKIGYAEDKRTFYSWLGAVLPEYRGIGIASDLMDAQHEWCRKSGFTLVRTKTQNRFKEMLLLNIKSGFSICGIHSSANKDEIELIMEKPL